MRPPSNWKNYWRKWRSLREGAFAPWSSQPVVRAVLLPVLTYGGAMLVYTYAIPGM